MKVATALLTLLVLATLGYGLSTAQEGKFSPRSEHSVLHFNYDRVGTSSEAPKVSDAKDATAQLGDITGGYPQCDPNVKQYSGYFDINATTNKHYFFWGFEARQNPETAPLILWLTGGPGCSSGLAVLTENGPCKFNADGTGLVNNTYSWNNVANIIYMDQPAGVGYSYSDNDGLDHNETMVAHDMYLFMQAFYTQYPQYRKNELFVYGESYGGHFAPATAHRLFMGNQRKEGLHVPLRGLSTGNGLTTPEIQYQYYADLAYHWCDTVKGAPCVNKTVYDKMTSQIPQCVEYIKGCNMPNNDTSCAMANAYCGYQMDAYAMSGLNWYDIRVPCLDGGLCYNFTASTVFFNDWKVQKALGVKAPMKWAMCNDTVNGMFGNDWMHNFDQLIPPMMEEGGIRVLVYAGDMDFICNWLGNRAWTLQLPWKNQTQYNAAPERPWYLDEVPAGRVRSIPSEHNQLQFTFLQIHGAGHMVPMNQPARALDMVEHFLFDKPFRGWDV